MAITFNTNVSALTSQRYLGVAADKTASSLAKLSSGSRVPTAKDDAAALAIGSKLKAEVTSLNQAANNAAQAVSLLQIADGALSTTGDILNRMKSLAVQASSGQLADAERTLLNQEFQNLSTEIDRIAQVTNFNGNTLLNGGDVVATAVEAKPGFMASKGMTMSFNTSELADNDTFRISYDYAASTGGTDVADGKLTLTNLTTGESQTIDIAAAMKAKTGEAGLTLATNLTPGNKLDVNFDALGVTVSLDDHFDVDADFNVTGTTVVSGAQLGGTVAATFLPATGVSAANLAAITAGADFDDATGAVRIQVDSVSATKVDIAATAGLEFSLDGVTFGASLSGVTLATDSVYVRAGGAGEAFARLDLTSLTSTTTAATDGYVSLDLGGFLAIDESTSSTKQFDFKVGTGVSTNDSVSFTLNASTTNALGINGASIATAAGADTAIGTVGAAISTVASLRADIGASQSRLDFAAASIAVAVENTTAAQSALMDVDVSAEMTEFTSQQVLLQAGISLLAQANQQPGLLLRLLQ